MANLAIKGHATRGKEVIEILEMLGGKSYTGLAYKGEDSDRFYCIDKETNFIESPLVLKGFQVFSLEEFLEKFPYKVGDKVRLIDYNIVHKVFKIKWDNKLNRVIYDTKSDDGFESYFVAEELEPYKEETMESKPNILQQLKEYFDNTPRDVIEKEWEELSHLNEIGPTVDEYLECVKKYRQSNQYPKTYEECCGILQVIHTEWHGYLGEVLVPFQKLLICSYAYWKIAGEQMGLGKPWSPSKNDNVYCIFRFKGEIVKDNFVFGDSLILEFPTEEMRDAFYENFKDLIEYCKELL
jgi:hypothetical protein